MQFSARFYRGAAICSLLSAITTLALIFLPRLYPPLPDFEARMALGANLAYLWRSWIYLLHPFLVFTAAFAVAVRCLRVAPGAASLGVAGFALWGATEAAQQALTKVALDRTWRAAWPQADAVAQEAIRQGVAIYDLLWDAMYLLLLLGFVAGNVLLALAVQRLARSADSARTGTASSSGAKTLASWVAAAFWGGAGLTLLMMPPEFGAPTVPGTAWLYPVIQPAGRTLIGIWLWQQANSVRGAPDAIRPASIGPMTSS